MNPRAPQIHGTIKLHKHDKPICPVVNWKEKSRIQNSETHNRINKKNTNVAKPIQRSEFTQSITIPFKHQNRQTYETLLV
jgi:hypothetical protein